MPVHVNVQNGGLNDQASMSVFYQINNGPVVSEVLPDTLFSGQLLDYTFTQTADLSAGGNYTIKSWVALAGDTANANDTSFTTLSFVSPTVDINDTVVCAPGAGATFTASGGTNYIWYGNVDTNGFIGTNPDLSVTIDSDTSYTVYFMDTIYNVTTLTDTGSFVDHNSLTGDDRGGIAITEKFVYFNGDNDMARYEALNLTNGVSLPRRDGIFSDLETGELYTLFDTNSGDPSGTSTSFTVNSIVRMDTDLVFVDTIMISQTIDMAGNSSSTQQAGIYAGKEFVLLYTGTAGNNWYVIDIPTGNATLINSFEFDTKRSNENWSSWGWATYKNGAYHATHRINGSDDIGEINVNSEAVTVLHAYTDLSDMASITFSPWLNRMYYHHESSSQLANGSENGGYVGGIGIDTLGTAPGCPATVIATISNSVAELGNDTIFCAGNTLTLNPGDFATYSWTPSATTSTLDVTTSGVYSVTATDAYGCDKSDTIDITVTPLPVIDLGADTVICEGSFLELIPGAGYPDYLWDNGSTSSSRIINAAGTYSVTVSENNCSSIEDIAVLVNPLPTVSLGPDTIVPSGTTLNFSAGSGYDSYFWSTTDTTAIISFTAFSDTYINVTVTDEYGCEGTDQLLVQVTVGVDEISQVNGMSVYPNPSPNNTNLSVNMAETSEASILVTDLTGKQMYAVETTFFAGEQIIEIPMSEWATGIYMINVMVDGKPALQGKLIKQ